MALVYVHCPECQSIDVVQYGKQANGTQRYRCNNRDCPRTIFLLQYSDKGRLPALSQMTENRKVWIRKSLIFQYTVFGFCLEKAILRQSPKLCWTCSGYSIKPND